MTRTRSLLRLALVLAGGVSAATVSLVAGDANAYMKMRGNVPNVGGGEGRFSDSDIDVVENLGQQIPSGLVLQDGHGKQIAVDSQLNQGKPVLVTMGYFRCPLLCNLVHEGLSKGLKDAGLVPGKDFLGLAVSIDPEENPKSAATNQRRLLRALGEPADNTWPFLMPIPGKAGPEARLAEAVG
ncbi:MAG TPA: SCO family protein, partial [Polyangia bacterium]